MMKLIRLENVKKEVITTPTGVYEVAVVDSNVLQQDSSNDTLGNRSNLQDEYGVDNNYEVDGSDLFNVCTEYIEYNDYEQDDDEFDLMEAAYNADFGVQAEEDPEDTLQLEDYIAYYYLLNDEL